MLNTELTDVEKRVIKNWYNGSETKHDINYDDPTSINLKFFRNMMRGTAYHEAGHLVTRMFTDLDFSHITLVSIIPDEVSNGRMVYECPSAEQCIEQMPIQIQRSQGYSLLLDLFAGHGSEMIMNGSECKTFFEYVLEEECADDDFDVEGTDLWRADRIANILSRRYFSNNRIMYITAEWTLEMLRMPAIWHAVETIAEMLISKGEVTNENEDTFFIIRDMLNVPRVRMMPKWSRRIYGK